MAELVTLNPKLAWSLQSSDRVRAALAINPDLVLILVVDRPLILVGSNLRAVPLRAASAPVA
jgi:hypothetical protein